MKPDFRLRIVVIGLILLTAGTGLAYNLDGRRWLIGSTVMHVGMVGSSPSGKLWSTTIEDAMAEWTAKTPFRFIVDKGYLDPCKGYSKSASTGSSSFPNGHGDGSNGIDFRSNVCGNSFGEGTLAITLTLSEKGTLGFDQLLESDIIVNDQYTWDVYGGPSRPGTKDFYRVMLHELGHALGLNHETSAPAIMAPNIGGLNSLQADDIAGANLIYGGPQNCLVTDLSLHALVNNSLGKGDCRILDLYAGGDDTSYVDTYRFTLSKPTHVLIAMKSTQLDSVLVLTDAKLKAIDIFDDSPDSCDAKVDTTLPAGEYLLLANTYINPTKCSGNVGSYTLTISDSLQPQLGDVANAAGAAGASTLITGGASSDGGQSFRTNFTADEVFDVSARLGIDPKHIGFDGKIYVLVRLGSGQQFSLNATGQFVPFNGTLNQLQAAKSGTLGSLEILDIARGLQGRSMGLAGQQISVFVGYALAVNPSAIYYGSTPIRFSIGL